MLHPFVTLKNQIRKPVTMHTYTTNSERTSISAVKEFFTDNTFELYNTNVVMWSCSFTQIPNAKVRCKNNFLRWDESTSGP